MNKLGILIGFVVFFSLFSQIGFSADYDLNFTGFNLTLNLTNDTDQQIVNDLYANTTHIFVIGGNQVNRIAFYNWNGGFIGYSHYPCTSNFQGNGFDWNGTHYGGTCTSDGFLYLMNGTMHSVENMSIYSNIETAGEINPYWLIGDQVNDKTYYYNQTGTNTQNISFGSVCTAPVGLTTYDDRIYVLCHNNSDNWIILRYNNNTTYENYNLNINSTCPNTATFEIRGIKIVNNMLYVNCYNYSLVNAERIHFLYEYMIEYQFATGFGNATIDTVASIKNLLGLATDEQALMLFSVGWSAFFGLLAVMVVRKQVVILFTSIFMIGIMAFSWVGWLPSIFTWLFVIIAGLLVAMKVRTIWVGDG